MLDKICNQLGIPQSARSSLSIKKSTRERLDLEGKKTVSELGIIRQDSLIVSFTAPSEESTRGKSWNGYIGKGCEFL